MSGLLSTAAVAGGAVCASAVAGAAYATVVPRAAIWGPVIWRGDATGQPRFSLTFDDGPSPDSTPRVLDALGELGVQAAFFVIGVNAARHPALLTRIVDEGHIIGNHSFDHHHLGAMRPRRYWTDQLARTDEVIERQTGLRPAFFRPPMGLRTPPLTRALAARGQHLITWTRRALDGVTTTDSRIIQRLVGRTRPGDIVVMHDGVDPNLRGCRDATVRALRPVISRLKEQGMIAARLDQIILLTPYLSSHFSASVEPGSP